MLPTTTKTTPVPAAAPTQPANDKGVQPTLPVPLRDEDLRQVGGGQSPGYGW